MSFISTAIDLVALSAVFSALMVITLKNPVSSVVFLIGVFICTTLYLLALGLGYLGLVYLIVYIGAIAILFLFVIMMLNLRLVEIVETGPNFTKSLPVATFLITALLFLTDGLNGWNVSHLTDFWVMSPSVLAEYSEPSTALGPVSLVLPFNPQISEVSLIQLTQVSAVGQSLYTFGALWLIVTTIILMLAMIGPILLCLK